MSDRPLFGGIVDGKPHLIFRLGEWRCAGGGWRGFGTSPGNAYAHWAARIEFGYRQDDLHRKHARPYHGLRT